MIPKQCTINDCFEEQICMCVRTGKSCTRQTHCSNVDYLAMQMHKHHQITQNSCFLRRAHKHCVGNTHNNAHNTKISMSMCTGKCCISIKNYVSLIIHHNTSNIMQKKSHASWCHCQSQEFIDDIMSACAQTHKNNKFMCMMCAR